MAYTFAILEPANTLAKWAFSDVYDATIRQQQVNTAANVSQTRYMSVEPEQSYHRDVRSLRYELAQTHDGNSEESPTEPNTDVENDDRRQGMIWTGHYIFQLNPSPSTPHMGWTAGREVTPDISLCSMDFAKLHHMKIRTYHVRFNFDRDNRAFFVASVTTSSIAGLSVNGIQVGRQMHALNQHDMKFANSLAGVRLPVQSLRLDGRLYAKS